MHATAATLRVLEVQRAAVQAPSLPAANVCKPAATELVLLEFV